MLQTRSPISQTGMVAFPRPPNGQTHVSVMQNGADRKPRLYLTLAPVFMFRYDTCHAFRELISNKNGLLFIRGHCGSPVNLVLVGPASPDGHR